jgi:hypothetical protein
LKIDRSFTTRLPDDREDCTLVSTIIDLAHAFDMTTVAECVETQGARHEIRALSAVLGLAVKWGAIDSNPLHHIGFPTFKPRDRNVTGEEFLKVRAVAHPMVGFAMNIAR